MPKKDTFYFPHDYNARSDVKCLFLRQQLGMEGYGIFWFLVESLADSGGYLPLKIIPVLAMQMQVPDVKVSAVIANFELFEVNENEFFSVRLNFHLQVRKTLSDKGKEGAAKMLANREALREASGGASAKESKVKEKKESKLNEIKEVFNQFPKNENLDFLPEMKINACLQLLKITRQIDINEKQVLGMWAVFRDQNITGEKFYKSKDDIYSHFINWIKTQKFEDANRTSTNSTKLGTSAARIEAARKF